MSAEAKSSKILEVIAQGENWRLEWPQIAEKVPDLSLGDLMEHATLFLDPHGKQNQESETFKSLRKDTVQGWLDGIASNLPDLYLKLNNELNPEVASQ